MSAPTADASPAKTNWLYRHLGLCAALVFIGMAIVAGLLVFLSQQPERRTLLVGEHQFKLEVASTAETAALGLGDRDSLPKDRGMLFELDGSSSACFWMKDMHFPLDIVWLSAEKRVVHLEQNVKPDTYPHSFCPSAPAKYVIELNAGTVASLGIKGGQALQF